MTFEYRSAEAVGRGHPDKAADQVSDAILDAMLRQDPLARAGIETMLSGNTAVVAGEIWGPHVDYEGIVRGTLKPLGYEPIEVIVRLQDQSPTIQAAVEIGTSGAGDQGIVYGYACRDTAMFMPAPVCIANNALSYLLQDQQQYPTMLGSDCKVQLTMAYENGKPLHIHSAVFSQVHSADANPEWVHEICEEALELAVSDPMWLKNTTVFVNYSGPWTMGGPKADTGLTGRKLMMDAYGGSAPHGGGAFSGKDPSKMDRTGAYAARYAAKNIVAAGIADQALVQFTYAIGRAYPIVATVNTFGGDDYKAATALSKCPQTPRMIREHLKLDRPIYLPTATGGHFGRLPRRDGSFSWEKVDLIKEMR